MGLIEILLVVILILAIIGALPGGPVVRNYGYWPGGLLGLVLLVLLLAWLFGRL